LLLVEGRRAWQRVFALHQEVHQPAWRAIIIRHDHQSRRQRHPKARRPPQETPWTDDKIRWDDDDDDTATNNNNNDDNDNDGLVDPFQAVDSTQLFARTFSLRNNSNTNSAITIQLQGYQAEADEIWKSTGLTLWRAADYLCEYLLLQSSLTVDHDSDDSADALLFSSNNNNNNCKVLELGAGLGLVGILVHHLLLRLQQSKEDTNSDETTTTKQGSFVCLTDGDTDALVQLRANVQRNCNNNNNNTNNSILVRQLIWGHEKATKFRHQHGTFDVILASDIVYAAVIVQPLWETVAALLRRPHGVFCLAFAKRRVPVTMDVVLEAAHAAGFTHKLVREDPTGIWVYRFRWKNDADDDDDEEEQQRQT